MQILVLGKGAWDTASLLRTPKEEIKREEEEAEAAEEERKRIEKETVVRRRDGLNARINRRNERRQAGEAVDIEEEEKTPGGRKTRHSVRKQGAPDGTRCVYMGCSFFAPTIERRGTNWTRRWRWEPQRGKKKTRRASNSRNLTGWMMGRAWYHHSFCCCWRRDARIKERMTMQTIQQIDQLDEEEALT